MQDPLILVFETASGVLVDDELFVDARVANDVRGEFVGETGTVALADVSEVTVRADGQHGGRVPVDLVSHGVRSGAYDAELQDWLTAVAAGTSTARARGTASPPPPSPTVPSRPCGPASALRSPRRTAPTFTRRPSRRRRDGDEDRARAVHVRRVPLTDLPGLVADLGYSYIELSPRADFLPFFLHPRAGKAQIAAFSKALAAAGVQISSVLPLYRWSGPDEAERQAAVRYWKRAIQITADLGVTVMNSEFNGRPEAPSASEAQFWRSGRRGNGPASPQLRARR